ncbi:MAG: hypothetical protein ACLQNE_30405 [Thermoguttaceae bacterium]
MFNGSRQVRAIALVAMAVLVVLVVGNRALLAEPRLVNAKNAPEVRALLAEFRENYVRLKDAYSNVYLEAVCHGFSRNSIKEPEPSDSVSRLAYRAREGAFFRTDLTMFPSGLASPPARTSVALVTPEGFLLASRESPEAKFVVAKWGENREYGLSMIGNSILAWAPFSVWIVPLDEYFLTEGSSRFQVAEVTQEKEGRDRIVAMTIQRGEAKGSLMVRVVFFRDRSWAVKEYAWGQLHADRPEALVRRARYDYEGSSEGIPRLKRLEFWEEATLKGPAYTHKVFDVEKIEFGPVPENEFAGEVVGVRIPSHRSSWTKPLVAIVVGVILMAIYSVLRRRQSRHSTKPNPDA